MKLIKIVRGKNKLDDYTLVDPNAIEALTVRRRRNHNYYVRIILKDGEAVKVFLAKNRHDCAKYVKSLEKELKALGD